MAWTANVPPVRIAAERPTARREASSWTGAGTVGSSEPSAASMPSGCSAQRLAGLRAVGLRGCAFGLRRRAVGLARPPGGFLARLVARGLRHAVVGGRGSAGRRRLLAVPGHRARDALGERHDHLVAERLAGPRDVRLRVEDVAGARRPEHRVDVLAEGVRDRLEQLEQAVARPAGHVAGQRRRHRDPRREHVRLDHVVDVGEVARHGAVAVDRRPLAGERRGDELGHDRRVLGVRVLARPEHVEVAQDHRLDAVEGAERVDVVLARDLGRAVGRLRAGQLGLAARAATPGPRRSTTSPRTRAAARRCAPPRASPRSSRRR